MQDLIWAILHHMISDDSNSLKEQHCFCPQEPDGWCTYWSNRNEYSESNRLPSVFLKELEPLFKSLSDSTLLSCCLKGLTQNQNEALNGVLWSKCPKTKFAGRGKVVDTGSMWHNKYFQHRCWIQSSSPWESWSTSRTQFSVCCWNWRFKSKPLTLRSHCHPVYHAERGEVKREKERNQPLQHISLEPLVLLKHQNLTWWWSANKKEKSNR